MTRLERLRAAATEELRRGKGIHPSLTTVVEAAVSLPPIEGNARRLIVQLDGSGGVHASAFIVGDAWIPLTTEDITEVIFATTEHGPVI